MRTKEGKREALKIQLPNVEWQHLPSLSSKRALWSIRHHEQLSKLVKAHIRYTTNDRFYFHNSVC